MSTLILTFAADALDRNETVHKFGPDETGKAGSFIESASNYGEPFAAYLVAPDGTIHKASMRAARTPFDFLDYATASIAFASVDSDDEYVAHFGIDGRA